MPLSSPTRFLLAASLVSVLAMASFQPAEACTAGDTSKLCRNLQATLKRHVQQQREEALAKALHNMYLKHPEVQQFTGSIPTGREMKQEAQQDACSILGWAYATRDDGMEFSLATSCRTGTLHYSIIDAASRSVLSAGLGEIQGSRLQLKMPLTQPATLTLDYIIHSTSDPNRSGTCCRSQGSITRKIR